MIVYVVNGNSSNISSEFDILEAGQILYIYILFSLYTFNVGIVLRQLRCAKRLSRAFT